MAARVAKSWMVVLVMTMMAVAASTASAVTITVDGNPSDWGIDLGPGSAADWDPLAGVQGSWPGGANNEYDYTGGSSGWVYPGYGGQDYDAEALYFAYDDTYAYFGVATGFPSDGISNYRPGDIALDFGCDGSWDFGIETTNWTNNTKGALYQTDNCDWRTPSYSSSFPSELKDMPTCDRVWKAHSSDALYPNLIYTTCATNSHYFIEAAVPIDQLPFSSGPDLTTFKAHWTMSCGNDVVETGCMTYTPPNDTPPPPAIPEPATCTLLGSSLLAMVALRVRKKKGKESKTA